VDLVGTAAAASLAYLGVLLVWGLPPGERRTIRRLAGAVVGRNGTSVDEPRA
jgi:hypothetical protein